MSDETIINIRLLDYNGAEKFRIINESCYKKADCCLLVYDITNRKSFIECQNYYRDTIKEKCKKNIKIILIGNKTDLEDKREISIEEGINFAVDNNYIFMETSCLKNENVYKAFESIIQLTNINLQNKEYKNENIKFKKNELKKNNQEKYIKDFSKSFNKITKYLSY